MQIQRRFQNSGGAFRENSKRLLAVSYLLKNLHLKCLTGF